MARVDFVEVTVAVEGQVVLRDVSLSIDDGELVGVIGPSGSGKTTLIRTIAGFTEVVSGQVLIDGVDVTRTPTAERDVGMVFQSPVLFRNRNVQRNVSFPLEIQRQEAAEIAQRVNAEVRSLHIEHLLTRHPDQLSRGESQLVQIARAMVRAPRVLLLDEPLASLDVHLQSRTRAELQMLQAGYGVTTLMTTNDPADALSMPSRLIVIDDGRIAQFGTVDSVRRHPATIDAALSTGECRLLPAVVEAAESGFWLRVVPRSRCEDVRLRAWAPTLADRVGETVSIGVRPDGLRIIEAGAIPTSIDRVLVGAQRTATFEIAGHRVAAFVDHAVSAGDRVSVQVDDFVVFDQAGHRIA